LRNETLTRKLYLIPGVNKLEAMTCKHAITALVGYTFRGWDALWEKVKTKSLWIMVSSEKLATRGMMKLTSSSMISLTP
jgi:hypothetical protein